MQEAAIREAHAVAAARGLPPYGTLSALPPHLLPPGAHPSDAYRLAAMYPPGSRERLELELDREKRERDARERDMREKELRELELREKMKQELPAEMKPPGACECTNSSAEQ